jgi:hypothetical protein
MKYEAMRRVKRKVGEAGEIRKANAVCVGCGCLLTENSKSIDSHLCKNCYMVNLAEIEAEDLAEDSMTDNERLAKFLG